MVDDFCDVFAGVLGFQLGCTVLKAQVLTVHTKNAWGVCGRPAAEFEDLYLFRDGGRQNYDLGRSTVGGRIRHAVSLTR